MERGPVVLQGLYHEWHYVSRGLQVLHVDYRQSCVLESPIYNGMEVLSACHVVRNLQLARYLGLVSGRFWSVLVKRPGTPRVVILRSQVVQP